jgi:hypothetical protein
MIRLQSRACRFRLALAFTMSVIALLGARAQLGTMPVFNVYTNFGADKTGGTDASVQITNAITAAINNGGGVVYFPAGTYRIAGPVTGPSGATVDMTYVVLRGSGVGSTTLKMDSGGSLVVTSPTNAYHSGTLENFTLNCVDSATAGLTTKDAVGIKVRDVLFSNCPIGVDMQIASASSTRNDFDEVTFSNCGTAVDFDQTTAPNPNDIFAYNHFRIWVTTTATESRVFMASGGATEQKGYFNVMGTLGTDAVVFDAHTGGSNLPNTLADNTYIVNVQGTGTSVNSYVFNDRLTTGTTAAGSISGVAQLQYDNVSFADFEAGSQGVYVTFLKKTAAYITDFTINGSTTSETVTSASIQTNSTCYAQPNDSTAGGIASLSYLVNPAGTGTITFNHPTTTGSGGDFRIFCSQPLP